ncbi:MAG: hypothetical protein HY754_13640, partial [Nitrospirae bacterium]|nr:hypothetical protein [Nitrospirota bacterium]
NHYPNLNEADYKSCEDYTKNINYLVNFRKDPNKYKACTDRNRGRLDEAKAKGNTEGQSQIYNACIDESLLQSSLDRQTVKKNKDYLKCMDKSFEKIKVSKDDNEVFQIVNECKNQPLKIVKNFKREAQ